jgi:tetratricopeptide (TPR) repeat protein
MSTRDRAQALITTGEALFFQGHLAEAAQAFRRALECDPSSSLSSNNLGVVYWHARAPLVALHYFVRALELDPDNRLAALNCGDILAALELLRSAAAVYRLYLARHPEDALVAARLEALTRTLQ